MASFCEDVHFYVILRKEQMWVPYKLKNTTIKIYSWVNKQANGNWLTCQIFLSQNSKIKTGFQVLYFFRLWKLTIALLILSMFSMLKTVGQTEKLLWRQKNAARQTGTENICSNDDKMRKYILQAEKFGMLKLSKNTFSSLWLEIATNLLL